MFKIPKVNTSTSIKSIFYELTITIQPCPLQKIAIPKDIKNLLTQFFYCSVPRDLLLAKDCLMLWHWHYLTRRNDKTLNRLSGDERTTAVDVCALMLTLFCRIGKIATSASVGGVMAFWTVKHGEHLKAFSMH